MTLRLFIVSIPYLIMLVGNVAAIWYATEVKNDLAIWGWSSGFLFCFLLILKQISIKKTWDTVEQLRNEIENEMKNFEHKQLKTRSQLLAECDKLIGIVNKKKKPKKKSKEKEK